MTLPYALRVNTQFPFPAATRGLGPVVISKANGIWTISLTIAQLSPVPVGFDPSTKLILIWDQVTQSFMQTTISALVSSTLSYRIVTAAGNVTPLITDGVLLMNKTVGAPTSILLPPSATRNGAPLTVKDYKGDALTNNITFVPNGAETIDQFSGAAAAANGEALIDTNYGKKTVYPLTSGGWYI